MALPSTYKHDAPASESCGDELKDRRHCHLWSFIHSARSKRLAQLYRANKFLHEPLNVLTHKELNATGTPELPGLTRSRFVLVLSAMSRFGSGEVGDPLTANTLARQVNKGSNMSHRQIRCQLASTLAFLISACMLLPFSSAQDSKQQPVRVYILAGQSNMEGKAKVALLEKQIVAPDTRERFAHLHVDGTWVERDDVFIRFLGRSGPLTVGYGSRERIGPELEFGHEMGNHFSEPVLLIKTAWGGKSLFRDFRPPSAGLPDEAVLEKDLERARKRRPETTLEDIRKSYGFYYREMLAQIGETLTEIDQYVPNYNDRGYQLAGFVWFQGWNDMVNQDYTAAYTENMIHFIKDVRRDLTSEDLTFVIGQLGVGGVSTPDSKPNPGRDRFKAAQAAAADLPEFAGNVIVVKTDQYWDLTAQEVFSKGWKDHIDEWEQVGSDYPFHYLGSARTYCDIGGGFARALISLESQVSE